MYISKDIIYRLFLSLIQFFVLRTQQGTHLFCTEYNKRFLYLSRFRLSSAENMIINQMKPYPLKEQILFIVLFLPRFSH